MKSQTKLLAAVRNRGPHADHGACPERPCHGVGGCALSVPLFDAHSPLPKASRSFRFTFGIRCAPLTCRIQPCGHTAERALAHTQPKVS